MQIHITNIYNLAGMAAQSQHMVTDIAKETLHCNELGLYRYSVGTDSTEMLRTRMDGILASVESGDIVIFQSPSWNGVGFDKKLFEQMTKYRVVKRIIFIHDIPPLMFESNRCFLGEHIELFNQADLIIVPSHNMEKLLQKEGLNVQKIVVQRMWDCPVIIDNSVTPQLNKVINFVGKTDGFKFSFVQEWKYSTVRLAVTANEGDWKHEANIEFLGWFQNQDVLANVIRNNGGFGLLWTENTYWKEYMKLNACSKLGLYLAAGLPVIVHNSIPEAETILRKNLGLVVDSLDEAVDRVENMTLDKYSQMVRNVSEFGELIRGGFFTKKALIDAVFRLLYD